MSKFIFIISNLVSKKCKATVLVKVVGIYQLMTYAEQIEEKDVRERVRKSKRDRVDGGRYSYKRTQVPKWLKISQTRVYQHSSPECQRQGGCF